MCLQIHIKIHHLICALRPLRPVKGPTRCTAVCAPDRCEASLTGSPEGNLWCSGLCWSKGGTGSWAAASCWICESRGTGRGPRNGPPESSGLPRYCWGTRRARSSCRNCCWRPVREKHFCCDPTACQSSPWLISLLATPTVADVISTLQMCRFYRILISVCFLVTNKMPLLCVLLTGHNLHHCASGGDGCYGTAGANMKNSLHTLAVYSEGITDGQLWSDSHAHYSWHRCRGTAAATICYFNCFIVKVATWISH